MYVSMDQNTDSLFNQCLSRRAILPYTASVVNASNGSTKTQNSFKISPSSFWGGNSPIHTTNLNPVWNKDGLNKANDNNPD